MQTLQRIVSKYTRDTHRLSAPASPEALDALESHLGGPLPLSLRRFLQSHNGASLFRGSLRLRSASDIARASETAPRVLLFADDAAGNRWGAAPMPDGRFAWGTWNGLALEPVHGTFNAWFQATVSVLETRVSREQDRESLRLEAAPTDPWLLHRAGVRRLHAGQPEAAIPFLARATQLDPGHVGAWQHLGDALASEDRSAARAAWLHAFQHCKLPLPWPGAPIVDPDLFESLGRAFGNPDGWDRELARFLEERCADAHTAAEAELIIAAAESLARHRVAHGDRRGARQALLSLVHKLELVSVRVTPWHALLRLAELESDLAIHDQAESRLRRIARSGPKDLQGAALVRLAHIVVTRDEPWAEEIIQDALSHPLSAPDSQELRLLQIERSLRRGQPEQAERLLSAAQATLQATTAPQVHARLLLYRGDLHRLSDRLDAARTTYTDGIQLLESRAPELSARLEMRLGDVSWEAGDPGQAAERYAHAVAGFAKHQLPLREAWALLRLARVSDDPRAVAEIARDLFLDADLATGVVVADAVHGQPDASLAWQVERATEHARIRQNAQRSRPPYMRADADRPERRLGGQRLAASTRAESSVAALADRLHNLQRRMRTGRVRPLDPPALEFVAILDLVAGHPSYTAARMLVEPLLDQGLDRFVRRAVLGAAARAQNVALTDALLTVLEAPRKHPPHAVAAAAEALGMRRETAAVPAMLPLLNEGTHPVVRKAAITAVGRLGAREHADRMVPALDVPSLAEPAALALLLLGDRRGIEFHGDALAEGRADLSGHPGEIVGRYGGPSHLLALRAATRADEAVAAGALQGLGLLGDPRGVPDLLSALSHRNPRIIQVATGALTILTGHDEDRDAPGLRNRWTQWWEASRDRFPDGVRMRHGRLFGASHLIAALENPDQYARATAYDELCISTGQRLPFESDGPWRVQLAQVRAWRAWWEQHRPSQPEGAWYLDGQRIS